MSWSNENFPGCDRFDGPDSRITGRLPRGDDDEGREPSNRQGAREVAPEEGEEPERWDGLS